jgi:hypothetical protein
MPSCPVRWEAHHGLARQRKNVFPRTDTPLVILAWRIDWEALNTEFGAFYEESIVGQPPKATRLMAGLLYLKNPPIAYGQYPIGHQCIPPH